MLRRRRLLRETGLELVLTEAASTYSAAAAEAAGLNSRVGSSSSGGVFLSFSTPALRDAVYRCILKVIWGPGFVWYEL